MGLKWTAIWWGSLCLTIENCILYVNHAEKNSWFLKPILHLHLCTALCYVLLLFRNLFCLDPNTVQIYRNTIVNNLSTMRKRHVTQFYIKVVIWVSNERQFDGDHYDSQWKIIYCMLIMLKKIKFLTTILYLHLYCICLQVE